MTNSTSPTPLSGEAAPITADQLAAFQTQRTEALQLLDAKGEDFTMKEYFMVQAALQDSEKLQAEVRRLSTENEHLRGRLDGIADVLRSFIVPESLVAKVEPIRKEIESHNQTIQKVAARLGLTL